MKFSFDLSPCYNKQSEQCSFTAKNFLSVQHKIRKLFVSKISVQAFLLFSFRISVFFFFWYFSFRHISVFGVRPISVSACNIFDRFDQISVFVDNFFRQMPVIWFKIEVFVLGLIFLPYFSMEIQFHESLCLIRYLAL